MNPLPSSHVPLDCACSLSPDTATYFNPFTGDRMTILRSATAEGETSEFEFTLPAGGAGAPPHRHHRLVERFTVRSGQLSLALGEKAVRVDLDVGKTVLVESGTLHRFWNASDQPVTFTAEVTPGKGFERFIRTHYGLAMADRAGPGGLPRHPLQIALMLQWADFEVPNMPGSVQRFLINHLANLGRRLGHDRRLSKIAC